MQHILVVINSYLNLKTYSITFINCLDKVVWWKLDKMWKSWKRFKMSWMGHGAWMAIAWGNMGDGRMGLKHNSWRYVFWWNMFWGLGLPKHQNVHWVVHRNLTCFSGWKVLRFLFQGSCFVTRNFRPTKMNVESSPKDDMFPCWFALRPLLPMHGNPRRATLKWRFMTCRWNNVEAWHNH
jgi:hypothetical protein